MRSPLQFPFLFGIPLLPASRVIGVDAGSRCLKLVLAERCFNRLRVLRREQVELPAAGNELDTRETGERLAAALQELGPYPVALAVPQHRTISQVLDLPPVERHTVARLVQNEVYKLGGLGQSKVAYDHTPLQPFGRHQHAYWVTLCQENEITGLADRLGIDHDLVCGATSAGNALINAYLAQFPETASTVIVDVGMRSTTLAIMVDGQGVHVANFALGNELFLETIAAAMACDLETAERHQRERNLLSGPEALPALRTSVDSWRGELMRVFREWLAEQAGYLPPAEAFQFVLTGSMGGTPVFAAYLNRSTGTPVFGIWPEKDSGEPSDLDGRFAIAKGVAAQALGKIHQPASLLPMNWREAWQQQREAQVIQSITFLLLLLAVVVLGLGTWQKTREEFARSRLLAAAENANARARALQEQARRQADAVQRLRPLLERQQYTRDVLSSLAWLQESRGNRALWFVLFADQQSYLGATPPVATNDLSLTNLAVFVGPVSPEESAAATNRPFFKPGFVAELCIPEEGEAMRRTLSQVVADLQKNPRFKNVDTVPPEQRRLLAEPKALLPNPERHFALFLELATNEFMTVPAPGTNPPSATFTPASPSPVPVRPAAARNPERAP